MRVTIDSHAWMEVIRGTRFAVEVEREVADSEASFVPSIVLAELAARLARENWTAESIEVVLRELLEAADVVEIDSSLAVMAGSAIAELRARALELNLGRPGLADAIVLATARKTGSLILTGDPHFEGFPELRKTGVTG